MSDRRIRSAADLDSLRFDEQGLVPVVAQDAAGAKVLMVAWANREALDRTVASGEVHFWSRSRGEIWRKGETSGNVLRLVALYADCDDDTVLALVNPGGPACHTGTRPALETVRRQPPTAGSTRCGPSSKSAPGPSQREATRLVFWVTRTFGSRNLERRRPSWSSRSPAPTA